MNPDPITPQFREGMQAFRDGLGPGDNPYPKPQVNDPQSYRKLYLLFEWREGWEQEQANAQLKEPHDP